MSWISTENSVRTFSFRLEILEFNAENCAELLRRFCSAARKKNWDFCQIISECFDGNVDSGKLVQLLREDIAAAFKAFSSEMDEDIRSGMALAWMASFVEDNRSDELLSRVVLSFRRNGLDREARDLLGHYSLQFHVSPRKSDTDGAKELASQVAGHCNLESGEQHELEEWILGKLRRDSAELNSLIEAAEREE